MHHTPAYYVDGAPSVVPLSTPPHLHPLQLQTSLGRIMLGPRSDSMPDQKRHLALTKAVMRKLLKG